MRSTTAASPQRPANPATNSACRVPDSPRNPLDMPLPPYPHPTVHYRKYIAVGFQTASFKSLYRKRSGAGAFAPLPKLIAPERFRYSSKTLRPQPLAAVTNHQCRLPMVGVRGYLLVPIPLAHRYRGRAGRCTKSRRAHLSSAPCKRGRGAGSRRKACMGQRPFSIHAPAPMAQFGGAATS